MNKLAVFGGILMLGASGALLTKDSTVVEPVAITDGSPDQLDIEANVTIPPITTADTPKLGETPSLTIAAFMIGVILLTLGLRIRSAKNG